MAAAGHRRMTVHVYPLALLTCGKRRCRTPAVPLGAVAGSKPLMLRFYILDQQASFQNVIVRLNDVLLINIFEPMN